MDEEGNMEWLSASECLREYSHQYISSRGDVLLIQNGTVRPALCYTSVPYEASPSNFLSTASIINFTTVRDAYSKSSSAEGNLSPLLKQMPYLSLPKTYPSYEWQCSLRLNRTCSMDFKSRTAQPYEWAPYGTNVEYCLSEKVQENCTLNFSLTFAIIVIVCNLFKVICMFMTLQKHNTVALITLGDAVQSFLERPDPYTRGFCVYSYPLIRLLMKWDDNQSSPLEGLILQRRIKKVDFLQDPRSKQWRPKARRWYVAASNARWLVALLL